MGNLLSEQQVEEIYGLSKRWLQKMRCYGNGPKFLKIGKKAVRYRIADIETFLAAHERSSTSAQSRPDNSRTK